MPPLPLENSPSGAWECGDQGAIAGTGESSDAVLILEVSVADPGAQYTDYVPCIVPRGTRSSSKRTLVDSSSTSASTPKKLRSLGEPISSSMLLGEHIIVLFYVSFGIPSLPKFFVFLASSLESLIEGEEEEEETPLLQ
jgi:hypothetical protein